jgi:Kef-type K+ transport system membrane component KefB
MDGLLGQTLLAVASILAVARLLGAVAVRLRQPRIGGEMLAGLLVGGALMSPWRDTGVTHHAAVLSTTAVDFVDLLGQLGMVLYLLLVGLSLSPPDIKRNAARITAVGLPVILAAVVVAPLAAAWFAGARWQLAGGTAAVLVMASALMVNGLPFVARILQERELMHGGFGATVLGASALVTALPFVLLSLAERRSPSDGIALLADSLPLLITLAFGIAGAMLWPTLASRFKRPPSGGATPQVLAIIAALIVGWLTLQLLGTALPGAFLVGIALSGSTPTRVALEQMLGRAVPVILVPVFMAAAGARLDPRMLDVGVLQGAAVFTALLVAVAAAAGSASARTAHIGANDARAITALINCRGLMLLVLGVQMADHRLIGPRLVAVFFIGAVATTLMTGPLLARAGRLARRAASEDQLAVGARSGRTR